MRVYPTARDHLQYHPYTVMTPEFIHEWGGTFDPEVPVKHCKVFPGYVPPTPDMLVRSKATINQMVRYANTNINFQICEDLDVLGVLHMVDAYLMEIYETACVDDAVYDYVSRVITLRTLLVNPAKKVLNRHQEWKEAYMSKDALYTLFSMYISLHPTAHIDPVSALGNLPQGYDQLIANKKADKLSSHYTPTMPGREPIAKPREINHPGDIYG